MTGAECALGVSTPHPLRTLPYSPEWRRREDRGGGKKRKMMADIEWGRVIPICVGSYLFAQGQEGGGRIVMVCQEYCRRDTKHPAECAAQTNRFPTCHGAVRPLTCKSSGRSEIGGKWLHARDARCHTPRQWHQESAF